MIDDSTKNNVTGQSASFTGFLSGLTLFEILSMVFPGGLLLVRIAMVVGNEVSVNTFANMDGYSSFIAFSFLAAAAYLVGIIHNNMMDLLWLPFRNNLAYINKVRHYIEDEKCPCVSFGILIFSVFLFCLLLSFCYAGKAGAVWSFVIIIMTYVVFVVRGNSQELTLVEYYKQYDKLRERGLPEYGSVRKMESQVAFLRNMIVPFALFYCCRDYELINGVINSFEDLQKCIPSLCVLLFVSALLRSGKIYAVVYEAKMLETRDRK